MAEVHRSSAEDREVPTEVHASVTGSQEVERDRDAFELPPETAPGSSDPPVSCLRCRLWQNGLRPSGLQ